MKNKKLSHIDKEGKANMVDVGGKPDDERIARAEGFIRLQPETVALINGNMMKKGDVLAIAEIAGIQAAKQTASLIPLCHPVMLSKVEVKAAPEKEGIRVISTAKTIGKTGVEMEALTAVTIALLTVYDMCKAVDKEMELTRVRLIEKIKRKPDEQND